MKQTRQDNKLMVGIRLSIAIKIFAFDRLISKPINVISLQIRAYYLLNM